MEIDNWSPARTRQRYSTDFYSASFWLAPVKRMQILDRSRKGWLPSAKLKPTFTFLGGIFPSKSIEYGKILNKKSEISL